MSTPFKLAIVVLVAVVAAVGVGPLLPRAPGTAGAPPPTPVSTTMGTAQPWPSPSGIAQPWPSPSGIYSSDVSPSITLYVRNAGPDMRWFTVLPTPDPPQQVGFDAMTGVACLKFPPNSRLSLVDRSPADAGAREVEVIVGPRGSDVMTPGWVDIAADGGVTTGDGVPTWWPDGPQQCRP